MTPKEYLRQIYVCDHKIRRLMRQKEDLRGILYTYGLVSPGMERDRVQASPDPDRLADLVAKIDSKERRITAEVDRLIDLKSLIEAQINAMPDQTHANLLRLRYVKLTEHGRFQTWEYIADQIGYEIRQVYRLHGDALQAFARMYLS